MAAKKKRRQLPEEDLAAAVADIINSPITRSNLSFLRQLATPAPVDSEQPIPKPMGLELTPMGASATPMGHTSRPIGTENPPVAIEPPPATPDSLPAPVVLESSAASFTPPKPMGVDPSPVGFALTPPGLPAETSRE